MNWREEIEYFDDDEVDDEVPPEPLVVESDDDEDNYLEPLSCITCIYGTTWISEDWPPRTSRAKRVNIDHKEI